MLISIIEIQINYKKKNIDKKEQLSVLNERYIIVDENGNPIIVGGVRLLGMDIIPLIGENGKEEIDENGNIIIIGPDGKPRNQDELEPILLDDDKPLVNEENRPFLGIDGVPLINGFGNPILGPGELYDRNNQVVFGVLGIVPKDNRGNPIKCFLNENNINNSKKSNKNDENEEEIEEEEDNNIINNNISDKNKKKDIKLNSNTNNNKEDININKINKNLNNKYNPNNIRGDLNIKYINDINNDSNNDNNNNNNKLEYKNIDNNEYNNSFKNYSNLKPLIGANGKPVKDEENNYILLDENNKPVKNTGITLLLDHSGKPVLNSKSKPILIDIDGKPIGLDNDNNFNKYISDKIPSHNFNDFLQNKPEQINNKNSQKPQPFYQKINTNPEIYDDKNGKKLEIMPNNKKSKIINPKKMRPPKNYNIYNVEDNNNQKLMRGTYNDRDKRDKGKLNYSECSFNSLQKINFMKNNEYKGACFACDVGCSVSRSGYSPMNYSPYNNLIRRRESTPLKNVKIKDFEELHNTQDNKNEIENVDNNYYLTEV